MNRFRFYVVAHFASFLFLIPTSLVVAQPREGLDDASLIDARIQASEEMLRAKWKKFLLDPAVTPPGSRNVTRTRATESGTESVASASQRSTALNSERAFADPPTSQVVDGVHQLRVDYAVNQIGSDEVRLRSYNGSLVGPTIRIKPGEILKVHLANDLPPERPHSGDHNSLHAFNTTNLHTHGLHVSPSGSADNVFLKIGPGESFDYEIPVPEDHVGGTFWYHAHKHGAVAAQVSSGMSGPLIIEGGLDEVAEISAARERIFVLQQIPYYNEGLPHGVIEPVYQDELFGPTDWDRLERFTTINGVVQPVIHMRTGEIERWRLIQSGFREVIRFGLHRVDGNGPDRLSMHEIAVDGLPLGKVVVKDELELWPGYRSDVLVKAPNQPATYLIVDERIDVGLNGVPEARKYLGKLVVRGKPNPMSLPAGDDLKPHRLPTVKDDELTGDQTAEYGIFLRGGDVSFEIDGTPYQPNEARELKLGDVEEWTLQSINGPRIGGVAHPFHIHVNPIEVVRIENSEGENILANGPIWRDTIILKPNEKVVVRTRYEDFSGEFVQHCHILDHEDQGMMEKVRISLATSITPPSSTPSATRDVASAPATIGDKTSSTVDSTSTKVSSPRETRPAELFRFRVVDPSGNLHRVGRIAAGKRMIVFVIGLDCDHCRNQLEKLVREFDASDILVISGTPVETISDDVDPLRGNIYWDRSTKLFRHFGCFENGPKHGLVILRGDLVAWSTSGDSPFEDVDRLRRILDRARNEGRVAVRSSLRSQRTRSVPTRRNIEDLSPHELEVYEHAIKRLRQSADPNNDYFFHADLHNVFSNNPPHGCEHRNELFLTWHRYHLYFFEKALQESDPNHPTLSTRDVTIPYWDWTQPHSGDRYPKAFEEETSELYAFRNTQPSAPWFESDDLGRLISENPNWYDYAGPADGSSYGALESPSHNLMHSDYIGGDMADPFTAAEDPIYWSFHAFIDLQFDRWQRTHGKNPSCMNCSLRGFPTRSDRLEPIVASVIDTTALGYTYEDNRPLPTPIRPRLLADSSARRAIKLASPLPMTRSVVSAWGGDGPIPFELKIPEPDFQTAKLTVLGLNVSDNESYKIDLFAHPPRAEVNVDSAEFRDRYYLGSVAIWKSHSGHGHTTADASTSVTRALKRIAQGSAGERWQLTAQIVSSSGKSVHRSMSFHDVALTIDNAPIDQ